MIEIVTGIVSSSFELLITMVPYLLFGFLFAGILSEFILADISAGLAGNRRGWQSDDVTCFRFN